MWAQIPIVSSTPGASFSFVNGQETEASTLYNAYLSTQQQLGAYQQIQAGLTNVTYNSNAGTVNIVHGDIVATSGGSLYEYSATNPESINLSGTVNYGDTNTWTPVVQTHADNPTVDAQIAFDQQELTTIEQQMIAQGTGAYYTTSGTLLTSYQAGAVFEPLNKVVQTIDVPAFSAQAGQINLFGDQIYGTGVLDAPPPPTST